MLISRRLARLRTLTARATDARLSRSRAALECAAAVKLQRWEALCEAEVRATRALELRALRNEATVKALNVMVVTIAPTLVSLTTFTALSASGTPLHSALHPSSIPSPSPSSSPSPAPAHP